jgi:Sap, sulfolipid-1-addressing protein
VSELFELVLLGILSAFWPTLVLVDVLAFQTPKPERILIAFLAGGLISTVTIGSLLVLRFQGTQILNGDRSTTDPALNFAVAGIAFLAAYVLDRLGDKPLPRLRRRKPRTEPPKPKGPSFAERAIDSGPSLAFVAGLLLNIVPGVFPFIALKNLAELDYSAAETVSILIVFYLIVFSFIELPIISSVVAPRWTEERVSRFNTWLSNNTRRVIVWALVTGGVYLTLRGLQQVISF